MTKNDKHIVLRSFVCAEMEAVERKISQSLIVASVGTSDVWK